MYRIIKLKQQYKLWMINLAQSIWLSFYLFILVCMYGPQVFTAHPTLWQRPWKVKHFVIPHEMLCEGCI